MTQQNSIVHWLPHCFHVLISNKAKHIYVQTLLGKTNFKNELRIKIVTKGFNDLTLCFS